jgi:hypothetical protein
MATMLPSHAGDDAVGVTWPRRDVDGATTQRCMQPLTSEHRGVVVL